MDKPNGTHGTGFKMEETVTKRRELLGKEKKGEKWGWTKSVHVSSPNHIRRGVPITGERGTDEKGGDSRDLNFFRYHKGAKIETRVRTAL